MTSLNRRKSHSGAFRLPNRVPRLSRLLGRAHQLAGGLLPLLAAAGKAFYTEGIKGVYRRLSYLKDLDATGEYLGEVPYNPRKEHESPIGLPREVQLHTTPVDIIVCVHNALDDVRKCLHSVISETRAPYKLVVVDDGSDAPTAEFLREFMVGQPGLLIRNDEALGYTRAANKGIQASGSALLVLLNSDTIVSPLWLDRLIECALAEERIGLVGPLSNTASWQSVPRIFGANGDWALNTLPEGMGVPQMADLIADVSPRVHPRVGFLNGFCLLVKRAVLDSVGLFDEDNFGKGYGEENDYCLRASSQGWELAVADDAYVYHAQSKSYSNEGRKVLVESADRVLRQKHAAERITQEFLRTRDSLGLMATRARVRVSQARSAAREKLRVCHEGRRIVFLLPVAEAGGGANVVLAEAVALARSGVDAAVANLSTHRSSFQRGYPQLELPVLYFEDQASLYEQTSSYDAIVATVYSSVGWLNMIAAEGSDHPVLGYYAQDFEPLFFDPSDPRYEQALESYTAFPVRLFTKTKWNAGKIRDAAGVESEVIGPSVQWDQFYPLKESHGGPRIRVAAMVRPSTPRRSPELTVRLLKRIARARPTRVWIDVFGVSGEHPLLQELKILKECTVHGVLDPAGMARLLGQVHIFLDCSSFQAMGLTCMEAMACGAAVVGPVRGGLGEVVEHEVSGLLVDTEDEEACFAAALRLIDEDDFRSAMVGAGLERVVDFFPEASAKRMMDYLFLCERPPREQV